ncbi:RNA polymerase sigma factor [Candidatus Uabimicrobium sp. HlEnr_7]|uniref:RNA polymerase sigma factor n=1 Tax=Candidatus Uabimicrobium helgolandensis TaxID=3095367 RepID=UPI00355723C1
MKILSALKKPSLAEYAINEMSPSIIGYLKNLTNNHTIVEDVFQNSLKKLCQTKTKMKEIKNVRAFIFTVVRNEFKREISHAQKQKLEKSTCEKEVLQIANPQKVSKLEAMCLEEALMQLSLEQREVIYLKIYGGMTFNEIAESTNIPMNTIASRYRYGLQKMQELLKEQV